MVYYQVNDKKVLIILKLIDRKEDMHLLQIQIYKNRDVNYLELFLRFATLIIRMFVILVLSLPTSSIILSLIFQM